MSQQQPTHAPDAIFSGGTRVNPPGLAVPEFTDLASGIDSLARRIPWWAWLVGGVMLAKYLEKGKRSSSSS